MHLVRGSVGVRVGVPGLRRVAAERVDVRRLTGVRGSWALGVSVRRCKRSCRGRRGSCGCAALRETQLKNVHRSRREWVFL